MIQNAALPVGGRWTVLQDAPAALLEARGGWKFMFRAPRLGRFPVSGSWGLSAAADNCRAAGVLRSGVRPWAQPQHLARPSFDEIEGTPSTGLSVTSATPVLKKSSPGLRSEEHT